MRYGVLADIHGNVQALQAVTAALGRIGVDRYLCAGDLVGYGAQPNECVEMIAGLEPICVAGNHDLMALGELSEERCIPLARRSMGWTRKVLSDDARAYLASLPRRAEAADGVVVAHGSLNDPEEYVLRVDQAAVQIGHLAREHPGARILVVGHTHRAFASDGSSTPLNEAGVGELALNGSPAWLLNPGAVGQWRERRALARFCCSISSAGRRVSTSSPTTSRGPEGCFAGGDFQPGRTTCIQPAGGPGRARFAGCSHGRDATRASRGARASQSGPDQSKAMCLLERPVRLHLKPKASTSSAVTVP
jgi:predicted phosphodiesterase